MNGSNAFRGLLQRMGLKFLLFKSYENIGLFIVLHQNRMCGSCGKEW